MNKFFEYLKQVLGNWLFLTIIIILSILCIFGHETITCFLLRNKPLIDIIIGIVGIVSALGLFNNYFAKKQREAVFGFYANMLVYLKRLSFFLGKQFPDAIIFEKLYTREASSKNCVNCPKLEHIESFKSLSADFLTFLSTTKDNVPPQKNQAIFKDWYENQILLVELFQRGISLDNESHGDCESKEELEDFYNKIVNSVTFLEKTIKKKLKIS